MPTVMLMWRDRNRGGAQEEGFRIYRDTAPLDPDALPTHLAELPPDTTEFEDDTVAADTTYYYAVSAFRDVEEAVLIFDPFTTAA